MRMPLSYTPLNRVALRSSTTPTEGAIASSLLRFGNAEMPTRSVSIPGADVPIERHAWTTGKPFAAGCNGLGSGRHRRVAAWFNIHSKIGNRRSAGAGKTWELYT